MKEMFIYTLDSFLRAIIRFWDNRFSHKEDPIEYYQEEVLYLRRRNEELQSFILNSIQPRTAQVSETEIEENFENMGRAIESPSMKRRRLEQESLASWNKMVQEAHEKKTAEAKTKSTDELEKEILN